MNLKSEALITVGSLGSIVAAVLVLMRSFNVPITDDQQDALLGFVAVIAPFLVGIVGRQFVFAQDTTQAIATNAAQTGNDDIGTPPDGAVKA